MKFNLTLAKKMSQVVIQNVQYKVLVTHSEVAEEALNILRPKCDITICEGYPEPTRTEILEKSKGMHGILWATHDKINAEALETAGSQLKAISIKSSGYDYVDVPEIKKRGIPIGHTPKVLNNAVAEIAIGLMIAAARRFHEGRLKILSSEWEWRPLFLAGKDIESATIGIVGLGGIGQTIAKRLQGFEVGEIIYCGHNKKPEGDRLGAKFVEFDEILEKSDFIFVCAPLTDETREMFNETTFSKMKPGCVFINVARGGLVNQDALIEALKSHKIFSAGIDVMTPEPLPSNHSLLELPNCIVVPHLGSATERTERNLSILAAKNLLQGLEGQSMISPIPQSYIPNII